MGRKKGSLNKDGIKHDIFFGVNLTKDQHYWLLKQANKEKTTPSRIFRKILNEKIYSENMVTSLSKMNLNIKKIKMNEIVEDNI